MSLNTIARASYNWDLRGRIVEVGLLAISDPPYSGGHCRRISYCSSRRSRGWKDTNLEERILIGTQARPIFASHCSRLVLIEDQLLRPTILVFRKSRRKEKKSCLCPHKLEHPSITMRISILSVAFLAASADALLTNPLGQKKTSTSPSTDINDK